MDQIASEITKLPAYIFDLDGVLSDNSARQYMLNPPSGKPTSADWAAFFAASSQDAAYMDTVKLLKTLQAAGYKILLVTGRSEDHEYITLPWLREHGIEPDLLCQRRHLDFRKDYEVKSEIFLSQIRPYYNVLGVFEDRDDCVKMWRGFDLTCYQPRVATY